MAGELVYAGNPATQAGKSVAATVYTMAGSVVASGISCAETGSTAIYVGNMPAAAAGRYIVEFFSAGLLLSQPALIEWDGSTEIRQTGDAFARIGSAGAGLTALGDTRLGYLDATVSSRLSSLSYTSPPSAATNAAAVWDALAADHVAIGSMGASLAAASSAGDPWAKTQAELDAYPAGSAGDGMSRIVAVPGAGPIAVIPAPGAAGECAVYINTVALPGGIVGGAKIYISPAPLPAGAGGFVIDPGAQPGRIAITTDADTGYATVTLPVDQTNGTAYHFECARLGINVDHLLVHGVFDMASFISNPS